MAYSYSKQLNQCAQYADANMLFCLHFDVDNVQDFAGLSSVFFTISMLPLVLILFTKQNTTAHSTTDATAKDISSNSTTTGTVMDIIAAIKLEYEQSLLYDQVNAY